MITLGMYWIDKRHNTDAGVLYIATMFLDVLGIIVFPLAIDIIF